MEGKCHTVCVTEPFWKIYTNSYGDIVEVVDEMSGYKSLREGKPTEKPQPRRETVVKEKGTTMVLICKQ